MSRSIEPTMNMSALFAPRDERLETRLDRGVNLRLVDRNLFQAFSGASLLMQDVPQTMPALSPGSGLLSSAWRLVLRVFEQGRAVLQGSQAPGFSPATIEEDLSRFMENLPSGKVRCEISVTGHRRELKPEVQEQIKSIGREALANALRHSGATCIEAEIEYSARRFRFVVRDNGCGIDPEVARPGQNTRWGLLGMRERAESIGAKLTIWSKPGAGTEVEVSVPSPCLTNASA
jgi:signal transduction histidine kinase